MCVVEDQSASIPGEKRARLDIEIPKLPNGTPVTPSGTSTTSSQPIYEAFFLPSISLPSLFSHGYADSRDSFVFLLPFSGSAGRDVD
jgi:hypothetical protein